MSAQRTRRYVPERTIELQFGPSGAGLAQLHRPVRQLDPCAKVDVDLRRQLEEQMMLDEVLAAELCAATASRIERVGA